VRGGGSADADAIADAKDRDQGLLINLLDPQINPPDGKR